MLVPVGGGNLGASCALVMRVLQPKVRLTGVQSEAAPAVYRSWLQGRSLRVDECQTFAGGLATTYPGRLSCGYLGSGFEHMLLVSDRALLEAAEIMLEETGHLPEGAGAAGLAGLLAEPGRYAGQRVVLLLSGSNFEPVIWEHLRGRAPL